MSRILKDVFDRALQPERVWTGWAGKPCAIGNRVAYDEGEWRHMWHDMHRGKNNPPPLPPLPTGKMAIGIFVDGGGHKILIDSVMVNDSGTVEIPYRIQTPAVAQAGRASYHVMVVDAHMATYFKNKGYIDPVVAPAPKKQ